MSPARARRSRAAAGAGRTAAADRSQLDEVVRTARIVVCCGSGGVGKTSTAAALAVRAAEQGRRTCVLTIDPARRLAQALGLDLLSNTPSPVEKGLRGSGSLDAMMLDMRRTFDELIERYARDQEQADRILANRFYQRVSSTLAGTQEYMAMEKLYELHESRRWELLVVDTPPTRSALDFLDAPDNLNELLDARMFRLLIAPAQRIGRGYLRGLNLATTAMARMVRRLTGSELLAEVGEFFAAFEGMYEGFRSRAQRVYDLLKDPGTQFVVVATPDAPALRARPDGLAAVPPRRAGAAAGRRRPRPARPAPPRQPPVRLARRRVRPPEVGRRLGVGRPWQGSVGGRAHLGPQAELAEGALDRVEHLAVDPLQVTGARIGPEQQAKLAGLRAEVAREHARRRLRQDPVDRRSGGWQGIADPVRVLAVRHPQIDLQAPAGGGARVHQHLGEEELVGYHHQLTVDGAQPGGAHLDVLYHPRGVRRNDQITFCERVFQEEHDAGDEVAKNVLQREAQGHGGQPETADHHAKVDPGDRQRDHRAEQHHTEVPQLGDQQVDVGLGGGAPQGPVDPSPRQAGDEDRDDHEDDGGEQVGHLGDESLGEAPEGAAQPVWRELHRLPQDAGAAAGCEQQ